MATIGNGQPGVLMIGKEAYVGGQRERRGNGLKTRPMIIPDFLPYVIQLVEPGQSGVDMLQRIQ